LLRLLRPDWDSPPPRKVRGDTTNRGNREESQETDLIGAMVTLMPMGPDTDMIESLKREIYQSTEPRHDRRSLKRLGCYRKKWLRKSSVKYRETTDWTGNSDSGGRCFLMPELPFGSDSSIWPLLSVLLVSDFPTDAGLY
jgi:hypothetical protein